jgi:SAM-dependent methyltransferase
LAGSRGRAERACRGHNLNRELLVRFLHEYPFQPATALWRSVEVDQVIAHGLPHGRGLDLGCGDGLLTRIILEAVGSREVVGVEPDPAEASLAQRLGIYAAVHVVGGDHVPEPDSSFDWVLSNSVLEHIDGIEPVLAEVARLLRPGGEFILTVPGHDFHQCLRGPLVPGASRERYLSSLDARLAHRRYWSHEEWREALSRHGMSLTSTTDYLSLRQVQRWESISRSTAGVLYSVGRRRRQPIDIQRNLGLRRPGRRMPLSLARPLASVLSAGLDGASPSPSSPWGAYLVVGVKPG